MTWYDINDIWRHMVAYTQHHNIILRHGNGWAFQAHNRCKWLSTFASVNPMDELIQVFTMRHRYIARCVYRCIVRLPTYKSCAEDLSIFIHNTWTEPQGRDWEQWPSLLMFHKRHSSLANSQSLTENLSLYPGLGLGDARMPDAASMTAMRQNKTIRDRIEGKISKSRAPNAPPIIA